MPKVTINHADALLTLERAVAASRVKGFQPSSKLKDTVNQIVGGSHLTYRYILATALLAKAVEPEANPLVIQAGARVAGAFDARSLCHKVIVPHEARLLDDGLGGSNEPYLNKPARFQMLSLKNAVRAGNDKRALIAIHSALSALKSGEDAFAALCDLAFIARKQKASQSAAMNQVIARACGGNTEVVAFLNRLVANSVHGETSALATAAVLWIMGLSRNQQWTIQMHPVNESGSSSNEIGDIDVYFDGNLIITAEVKDKTFNQHDVDHAVGKVMLAGHHTLHFIRGPHSLQKEVSDEHLTTLSAEKGVELLLLDLSCLIADVVSFAPQSLSLKQVAEKVREYANTARVKTDALAQIASALF